MEYGDSRQSPLRNEPVHRWQEWPVTIVGIGIGLPTIFIGSWVLMFAAIGGVSWEPFYWLVFVWMVAPVAAGVPLLWYVTPERRTVMVYAPGQEPVVLGENDVLDGGEVFPGTLPVADIFA